MIDTTAEPRDQHYHFVHEFVRDSVFKHSGVFLDQLSRGRETGLRFLTNYWTQIPVPNKIPPTGMDIQPFDLDDEYRGFIITFPAPQRVVEGYMGAVVVNKSSNSCRYITLELGVTEMDDIEIVLCEWTPGGHKNYGTGPDPTVPEFVEAVRRLVAPNENTDSRRQRNMMDLAKAYKAEKSGQAGAVRDALASIKENRPKMASTLEIAPPTKPQQRSTADTSRTGKNLERAKQFQRELWEAGGREWNESDFNDRWVFSPMGADWDEWQRMGLMPISFCPLCGDDDLNGGTTITKKFSLLNVQIPFCSECVDANPGALRKEHTPPSVLSALVKLLIPLLVLAAIIYGIYVYLIR